MRNNPKKQNYNPNIIDIDNSLDNFGMLTESMPNNATKYDFGLMRKYCREKNKTISELTEAETKQFENN